MYLICWEDDDGQHWEIVSGYDAFQERVSELTDAGVEPICGEQTEDTI